MDPFMVCCMKYCPLLLLISSALPLWMMVPGSQVLGCGSCKSFLQTRGNPAWSSSQFPAWRMLRCQSQSKSPAWWYFRRHWHAGKPPGSVKAGRDPLSLALSAFITGGESVGWCKHLGCACLCYRPVPRPGAQSTMGGNWFYNGRVAAEQRKYRAWLMKGLHA